MLDYFLVHCMLIAGPITCLWIHSFRMSTRKSKIGEYDMTRRYYVNPNPAAEDQLKKSVVEIRRNSKQPLYYVISYSWADGRWRNLPNRPHGGRKHFRQEIPYQATYSSTLKMAAETLKSGICAVHFATYLMNTVHYSTGMYNRI